MATASVSHEELWDDLLHLRVLVRRQAREIGDLRTEIEQLAADMHVLRETLYPTVTDYAPDGPPEEVPAPPPADPFGDAPDDPEILWPLPTENHVALCQRSTDDLLRLAATPGLGSGLRRELAEELSLRGHKVSA